MASRRRRIERLLDDPFALGVGKAEQLRARARAIDELMAGDAPGGALTGQVRAEPERTDVARGAGRLDGGLPPIDNTDLLAPKFWSWAPLEDVASMSARTLSHIVRKQPECRVGSKRADRPEVTAI